jgi:F-box interacting protein
MYWFYDIYLWNPSTGFHKKIPWSRFDSVSRTQHLTDFYGFGYDQSTNDYLLVRMSSDSHNYDPPPHLEFFSLRANKWKQIEGTQFSYTRPIGDEQPRTGFLFNGAIHWFAYCRDLQKDVIVGFDLMEKKLFNMHLPNDFPNELNDFGLWVFGEFLSLWAEYYFDGDNDDVCDDRLEIWVMKDYKMDSPWTKILVHSFDDISPKYFFPICSTKSGDIIGTYDFTLAKCDDKGQLLEYHSYFNNRRGDGCEVALYTESLLSLPDNEEA